MTLHTRQSGAWAKVNGLFIRQSGVWTPVKNAYVRDGGVWKVYYSSEIVVNVTTNYTSGLILNNLFTNAEWISDTPKRVVIAAGVVISGTTWGALATKGGQSTTNEWGGILTLDNYGTIQGRGGVSNSGVGGSALYEDTITWSKKCIVNNFGTIRSGGGGGGQGGSGSVTTSGWTDYSTTVASGRFFYRLVGFGATSHKLTWDGTTFDQLYNNPGGSTMTVAQANSLYSGGTATLGGVLYQAGGTIDILDDGYIYIDYRALRANVTSTTPTVGGAGGRGLGSDGAAAAGAAGGTNAGTGGTGGGWGAAGATGAAGNVGAGVAGGAAGVAYNAANWSVTNTGTIQGRVT